MNCSCSPPEPVVIRTVAKSNSPNFGRQFYSCAASMCGFFCWVEDSIRGGVPTSRYQRIKSSSGPQGTAGVGKITAKMICGEFEEGPPFRVWFNVQCPVDPELVAFFQTIPQEHRKYTESLRMWSFDFAMYDQIVSTLLSSQFSSRIVVSELPKFLVRGIKKFVASLPTTVPDVDLLGSIADTLLSFQMECLEFVIRRGGRAMIGDEMGCGKTLEALAVMQQYRAHLPALVLTPPSILKHWESEIAAYSAGWLLPKDVCVVRKAGDRVFGKVCVASYTLLERLVSEGTFSACRFGIVIADESHQLKSKEAKRTTLALPLLKQAKVAICLSGTPAVNRPVELYTQLNGLLPGVFNDYDAFTSRYCDPKKPRFGTKMDVSGSSNESELRNVLEGMVMIRRLKSEVIRGLPPKKREVRRVKPDAEKVGELQQLRERMRVAEAAAEDPTNSAETAEILRTQSRTLMNQLCGVTGMSKIKKVMGELRNLLQEARDARRSQENEQLQQVIENTVEADTSIDLTNRDSLGIWDNSNEEEMSIHQQDKTEGVVSELEEDILTEPRGTPSVLPSADDEGLQDTDEEDEASKHRLQGDDDDGDIFFMQRSRRRKCFQTTSKRKENVKSIKSWREVLDYSNSSVGPRKKGRRDTCSTVSPATTPSACSIGGKVLVFAHHSEVMDAIEAGLRAMDVRYIRIDGSVQVTARGALISRFQTDRETEVALLSITACGMGLNFTSANVAVFAELHWGAGHMLQAEDRIHRLGQKSDSVRIVYILAEGTSDDIVWEQIQRKNKTLAATVGIDGDGTSVAGTRTGVKDSNSSGNSCVQKTIDSFMSSTSPCKNTEVEKKKQTASVVSRTTAPCANPFAVYGPAPPSASSRSVNIIHNGSGCDSSTYADARNITGTNTATGSAKNGIETMTNAASSNGFIPTAQNSGDAGCSRSMFSNSLTGSFSNSAVGTSTGDHGEPGVRNASITNSVNSGGNTHVNMGSNSSRIDATGSQGFTYISSVPPPCSSVPSNAVDRPLSPATMARIEENRRRALEKQRARALAKQTVTGIGSSVSGPVTATSISKNSNGMEAVGHAISRKADASPSPPRACPPERLQVGHVFSTGRGSSVPVSQRAIEQATGVLNSFSANSNKGATSASGIGFLGEINLPVPQNAKTSSGMSKSTRSID